MLIEKWWGNFIGGSDDSLLLLDYLASKSEEVLHLKEIMDEINLTKVLEDGNWEEGNLSWKVNKQFEPDFDLVADVVIDLATITLESLVNKNVAFKSLDKATKYHGYFSIQVDKDSLSLLIKGLEQFIGSSPHYSGLADVMDEGDLLILSSDCKEICSQLKTINKELNK